MIPKAMCVLIALFFPLTATLAATADYDQAVELLQRGKPDHAEKIFQDLASSGDPRGMFGLGVISQHYSEAPGHLEASRRYYELAAKSGSLEAMHNLAFLYQHGAGAPKDIQRAIYWYGMAADRGLSQSQFDLAWLYDDGTLTPRDHTKARHYYELAARSDDFPDAMYNFSLILLQSGNRRDRDKALSFLERASSLGHEPSTRELMLLKSSD
jgi:TPR repeat protein